jgi:hypothetical protein
MRHAQEQYEASPAAAGKARRFVGRLLDRWGHNEVKPEADLLTSEIVADAVRQSPSHVTLLVEEHDGVVRIEVSDVPGLITNPKASAFERRTGRRLVRALSRRWGSEADSDRTTTWVELPGAR